MTKIPGLRAHLSAAWPVLAAAEPLFPPASTAGTDLSVADAAPEATIAAPPTSWPRSPAPGSGRC